MDRQGVGLLNLDKLINSQESIIKSNIYKIDKIYWLVEDCKKFGTSSFVSVARCAFIANDFLNSLVKKNIFSKSDRFHFLGSIKTVVSEMNDDLEKLSNLKLKKKYDLNFKKLSNLETKYDSYIFLGLLVVKCKKLDFYQKINCILKIIDKLSLEVKNINKDNLILFKQLLLIEKKFIQKII